MPFDLRHPPSTKFSPLPPEVSPSNTALWTHESLNARASPLEQPLYRSGCRHLLRVVEVGWAVTRGGPCWSQVCPTQLPGSLISQHQQLLPQNTWHPQGRTQDSAKAWGCLDSRSSQGKAGFQNLHGHLCRLSPHPRLKPKCSPTPTAHASLSGPAMNLAGFSSQEWTRGIISQVDREVAGESKVSPVALTPQAPCSVSQGWEGASQVRMV